ncbi:MAG: MFS transporter [Firmicutes bacterium]|nr:MFS transporter [Bacillota bacterium]
MNIKNAGRLAAAAAEYWGILRSLQRNAKLYLVYTAFNSIGFSIFSLVFNLYVHSLGFGADFIGLLNALPSIAVLLLGLPVGMMADRLGYRPFLLAGAVVNIVSSLGLALSGGREALMAFSFLSGLAGVLSWVIGAPMMMAYSTEKDRVHLFSINFALMMGAGFLGSLVAGWLPEGYARWASVGDTSTAALRAALLAMVASNVAAFLPTLFIRDTRRLDDSERPSGSWLSSLPRERADRKLFLQLLLPQAIIGFGAGAMVVFFQLFFNLTFHLSTGAIGVLFAFSSVVTALAAVVAPVLSQRWGKVQTVVWTQAASLPFLLILAFSRNLGLVVAAYYVRSALMNMSGPVSMAFSMEKVKPSQRATLTSLQSMLGSLGRGGLGPLASGFLQEQSGFGLAFSLTFASYLVATVLFGWFFWEDGASGPRGSGAVRAPGGRRRLLV